MRIGIYCGSFDPPHLGHLILPSCAFDEFNLDKIIYVPSYISVNKSKHYASAFDRYAMLKLLLKNYPLFTIEDYEIKQKRLVYTFETITYLKEKYDLNKKETYLFIGADWVKELNNWKNFDIIRENINFLVFSRNNIDINILEKLSFFNMKESEFLILNKNFDVSSSEIRNLIKENKQFSHFLTESVYKYILDKGLYI